MDPLTPEGNQVFSYHFLKSVLQDPNVWETYSSQAQCKPFSLDPPKESDKTKKDIHKRDGEKEKEGKKNTPQQRPRNPFGL